MKYGYKKETSLEFSDAVKKVREELKKEGFGVLTEINVKETLKEKLDVDYDDYIILGVCNPPFAYKALQIEKDIGLLLPCNVIVYSDKEKGKTIVSAINPMEAMSIVGNPEQDELKEIANSIGEKLKSIVDLI